MQNVKYNYFKNVYPFLYSSKFSQSQNFMETFPIKNLEVSLDLVKIKSLPEVLFWVLFSLNKKKPNVSYYFKKKHFGGKSFIAKVFLKISKRFGNAKAIIKNMDLIQQKMLLLAQELELLKSFPKRRGETFRVFHFYNIKFEEGLNNLINLAPNYWYHYDMDFCFTSKNQNGYCVRFVLQNLSIPVI